MSEELFFTRILHNRCTIIETRWPGRDQWRAVYFGGDDWGLINRIGAYVQKTIAGCKVDNRPSKRTMGFKYEVKVTIPSADKNQGLTLEQVDRINADFYHLHDLSFDDGFCEGEKEIVLNGHVLGDAGEMQFTRIVDLFAECAERMTHQELADAILLILNESEGVPF